MRVACYIDEYGVPWHYVIPDTWFELHRANPPEMEFPDGMPESERRRLLDCWIVARWHWHNQQVRLN